MFNLMLENKNGDQLTFSQNSPFTVTEIQGLNPPDATINTSAVALLDGEKYISAKVNMRQINVAFAIEVNAALNRINVYKVLKSKQWIRLYYDGDYRHVYIDGYIQSIDITYFEMKQIVTCTILCPEPFFKDAQEMINELSVVVSAFHFPFASTEEPELVMGYIDPYVSVAVENAGDTETGLIFTLIAIGAVTSPKIFDVLTGNFIGINYEFSAGDQVTIDTRRGHKTITLLRNGVESNLFNSLMKNSTWLQLPAYGGVYAYEVASGDASNLTVEITHYTLYEGV